MAKQEGKEPSGCSLIPLGTSVIAMGIVAGMIKTGEYLVEHCKLPRLPIVLATGVGISAGIYGFKRILFRENEPGTSGGNEGVDRPEVGEENSFR